MFRRIVSLCRRVELDGEWAITPAVYGDANNDTMVAQDCGLEGVACIDDAARALELMCDVTQATSLPWARELAEGLLQFVLNMQEDDGLFANFIIDWSGTKNLYGLTSKPAADSWWQARAVASLAKAWTTFGDEKIGEALDRGLEQLFLTSVPADIRSIQAQALSTMWSRPRHHQIRERLTEWCEEIAACRAGDMLLNSASQTSEVHLWAHIQEGVLAHTSILLERPDLLEIAARSARSFLAPIVESGFDQESTIAYDVASVTYDFDRLFLATGETEYQVLAMQASQWFNGRNTAKEPTYNRGTGRIADGIDHGVVNPHSGAESNIVGAQALFTDVIFHLQRNSEFHPLVSPELLSGK